MGVLTGGTRTAVRKRVEASVHGSAHAGVQRRHGVSEIEAGLPAPPGGGPSVGYRGGFVCLSDSSARWLFVRDMGLFGVGSSIGGGLCAGASNQFRAGLYFRSSVCGLACRFAFIASAANI